MSDMTGLIKAIRDNKADMFRKDFLLTWERSLEELRQIIHVAEALRHLQANNISARVFESGLAVANFRDKSTRTRFSFSSAANLLGLAVQEIDETKSQIAHGETVRETANMISFLTEIIGIRDDMFLGAGHTYMVEVAEALQDGFEQGVLPQRPCVVNLQCDLDHPTQTMADLMWLREHFGSLEKLKGKKLAMTWAYSPSYGKPLSVPQGIIGLMTRFGMNVSLAYPPGYDLAPGMTDMAQKHAKQSGGSFEVVESMADAFAKADIVYPKSWAPFAVMEKRTELLKARQAKQLDELEKSCIMNNSLFKDWECTEELMAKTKGGKALYMHCLPADISGVSCESGEVAARVFEKYRIPTYKEASYKPYVIAAMILTCRVKDPAGVLEQIMAHTPKRMLD